MRAVVDASVVAAALIRPRGWTAGELARTDLEFYIPNFLLEELEEHVREFAEIADVSTASMRGRIAGLRAMRIVNDRETARFLNDPIVARAAAIVPDDAPYLAAVLAVGADFLWTRDNALLAAFPSLAVRIIPSPS